VPRAATTSDVFNAIADARRRELLAYLAPMERPVGDMVTALRLRQPSISKHLKVLRSVGLVRARRCGRQVMYRTDANAIKPVHDWARLFETYWTNQLLRVKTRAEQKLNNEKA
jgi:DNA-binding transcriptional ArsR family regulator